MNRTLRFGSTGNDVAELQKGLNLLSSALAALVADGVYGTKTTGRVKEFQSGHALVPDGVTGPLTWQTFLDLLAQVPPIPPVGALDPRLPLVLLIAQQHFGVVDFQQMVGGRPKGIDFLIEMFSVAAGTTLTDTNFRNPITKVWSQEPWISNPNEQKKSWCGIFCVYCYKKAGFNVSWSLKLGKPSNNFVLSSFSSSFVKNIHAADMGTIATKSHHFLIESVNGTGPTPVLSTIDGNQAFGRITRRNTHRVGTDNFNYYKLS